jgi:hypothetical protein
VDVEVSESGALRALLHKTGKGGEEEEEEEGLALTAAELAAVSESMRDAQGGSGWYRIRAVGAGGEEAAVMTSVPMVRACGAVRCDEAGGGLWGEWVVCVGRGSASVLLHLGTCMLLRRPTGTHATFGIVIPTIHPPVRRPDILAH